MEKERTLVLFKPDSIQRGLVGEIISRFERVGLKIVALKMLVPTEEMVREHYAPTPEDVIAIGERSLRAQREKGIEVNLTPKEQGEMIVEALVKYLTSGPVIAMVLEGIGAIPITKKLVGSTEPLSSDAGTIRGDYTLDSYALADKDKRAVRNLVHCSGNKEEAEREIKVWFREEEIINYRTVWERILYDVNLDGILE